MASKSIVKEMRRRRLGLDMERGRGIEDASATVATNGALLVVERPEVLDAGGADDSEVEAVGLSTCASFQIRRPSIPPSTEIHSPEMCPAAR